MAVVTNISPDHFGEYGIHDLDDLAEVKLTVAARAGAPMACWCSMPTIRCCCGAARTRLARIGWFALDDAHPQLQAHRSEGGMTCGVRDGRLWLSRRR